MKGFPIASLLFTADEVATDTLDHAIRFILPNTRMKAGEYVHPASHAGGPKNQSTYAIIYGSHFRLRADFDVSSLTASAQVVARALQKYGMFLADGGIIYI